MEKTSLNKIFDTVVYGDTVPHGKPAPDIYLEALRRLEVLPEQAVGIEDSANGVRSLKAVGMHIIAVPSPVFPLPADVLALADVRLSSLTEFSTELVQSFDH
jgi:beta-phosphoglucomutase-like phosphatase (HAD superfamily)